MTIASALGLTKDKALPALLGTEIKFTRSVIHSCAQASIRAINESLGIDDMALADEYLATSDGQALMRGLKGYALFALGKTI